MDFVDGLVVRSPESADALSPEARAHAGHDLVDVLARIHAVDPDAVGLGDLGRKEGYVTRQLKRWYGQWEKSKTRDLTTVDVVHDLLSERIPDQGPAAWAASYEAGGAEIPDALRPDPQEDDDVSPPTRSRPLRRPPRPAAAALGQRLVEVEASLAAARADLDGALDQDRITAGILADAEARLADDLAEVRRRLDKLGRTDHPDGDEPAPTATTPTNPTATDTDASSGL